MVSYVNVKKGRWGGGERGKGGKESVYGIRVKMGSDLQCKERREVKERKERKKRVRTSEIGLLGS